MCWALHNEQLQLPPTSTEWLEKLASLPLQLAEREEDEGATLATSSLERLFDSVAQEEPDQATPGYTAHSQPFAQGGFGEVWRAERHTNPNGRGRL
jgi:hypothetical protein